MASGRWPQADVLAALSDSADSKGGSGGQVPSQLAVIFRGSGNSKATETHSGARMGKEGLSTVF